MKNPHGTLPKHYIRNQDTTSAITFNKQKGPCFSNDIQISSYNGIMNSISFCNNDKCSYKYDTKSNMLIFTNSTSNELLDFEVYTIDFQGKDTIYSLCKYPDIIWKYVHTNVLTKKMIRTVNDDTEILHDLSLIHITDNSVLLQVSKLWIKNPSEMLVNTQIVEKKYDSYLKLWLGKSKWRLIYRASEHEYTAKSFHEYCDDKGPTLIIIKSTHGWIFGGYTTQSWYPIKSSIDEEDIGMY